MPRFGLCPQTQRISPVIIDCIAFIPTFVHRQVIHLKEDIFAATDEAVKIANGSRIIDKDLTVRRVTLVSCNLIPEGEIPADAPEQLDLFTDYAALEKKKRLKTPPMRKKEDYRKQLCS